MHLDNFTSCTSIPTIVTPVNLTDSPRFELQSLGSTAAHSCVRDRHISLSRSSEKRQYRSTWLVRLFDLVDWTLRKYRPFLAYWTPSPRGSALVFKPICFGLSALKPQESALQQFLEGPEVISGLFGGKMRKNCKKLEHFHV